jgi:ferrochelatase
MEVQSSHSKGNRLFSGRSFSSEPLDVSAGDRVGVVLLVPGAPESKDEVFTYLYRRYMMPELGSSGVRYWTSHFASRFKARISSRQMVHEYNAIGGGHSINRLSREQASDLSRRLKASMVLPEGVKVETYLASPFGSPSMLDAAKKMVEDGITHVVLLPLFPQYALDTTGRALGYWESVVKDSEISSLPTVAVWEFAVKESFVAALNERIDQALQRFPRSIRGEVTILFAAHGQSEKKSSKGKDPYCCLVHHTVDRIMSLRSDDRSFHLSFVRERTFGNGIGSNLKARLASLVAEGKRNVVVVPVDHVTEQFDTAYLLDVELRKLAERSGISHYQVVSGLNCHSLFMEGLADLVIDSIIPSKLDKEAVCMHTCPRSSWGSVSQTRSESCSVCPFADAETGNTMSRPSQVHAPLNHAMNRPSVPRTSS